MSRWPVEAIIKDALFSSPYRARFGECDTATDLEHMRLNQEITQRWEDWSERGLSDDDLETAIQSHIWGWYTSEAHGSYTIACEYGRNPRVWFGTMAPGSQPPDLEGAALLEVVRRAMDVPLPEVVEANEDPEALVSDPRWIPDPLRRPHVLQHRQHAGAPGLGQGKFADPYNALYYAACLLRNGYVSADGLLRLEVESLHAQGVMDLVAELVQDDGGSPALLMHQPAVFAGDVTLTLVWKAPPPPAAPPAKRTRSRKAGTP